MQAHRYAADSLRQYRDNQVRTAGPPDLVVMLYDGALRFIRQAGAAMAEERYDQVHLGITQAQRIVTELTASLDLDQGTLARSLYRLYEYMNYRLTEADLKRDSGPLAEVGQLLDSLRGSWAQAALSWRNKGR